MIFLKSFEKGHMVKASRPRIISAITEYNLQENLGGE